MSGWTLAASTRLPVRSCQRRSTQYFDGMLRAVSATRISDVSDLYEGDSSRMDSFSARMYWTRGWTLQELIAPPEVEFFDRSWKYVNSRTTAAPQIARITGIDVRLLSRARGNISEALERYSVAQRLSWAANRMTTRLEDRPYSLLGLFGVNMPLLYGEGNGAFARLQEEILKSTADLSILAWPRDPENGLTPLARSAGNFNARGTIVKMNTHHEISQHGDSDAAVLTGGLRVRAPVVIVPTKDGHSGLAMLLGCRYESDITTTIALKLSPTSGTSDSNLIEAMKVPRLDCSVGWTSESGRDRLVPVDTLDAVNDFSIKTIFIRRDRLQDSRNVSAILSRPRGWTRLWLRFDDARVGRDWDVLDIRPKLSWNRSNRTFDLVRARQGNIRKHEAAASEAKTSTFGLPVHGAIALSNKSGDRIAVFFCQSTHPWMMESRLR